MLPLRSYLNQDAPNDRRHGLSSPSIVDLETFSSLQEEASEDPTTSLDTSPKTKAIYASSGATKPRVGHRRREAPAARRKEYVGAKGISLREDWEANVEGQDRRAGNEQEQRGVLARFGAEGASESSNTGISVIPHDNQVTEVQPTKTSQQLKRNPRKSKQARTAAAAQAVSPEIIALFRAPLLAPNISPPIAGIAAAAVASSGSNRSKM